MIGPGSLKRNFLINLASPLTRVAVAFVSIPLYVHHVGNARYGVINLTWALLGYAGFLDLGMSRAAVNALWKARGLPARRAVPGACYDPYGQFLSGVGRRGDRLHSGGFSVRACGPGTKISNRKSDRRCLGSPPWSR